MRECVLHIGAHKTGTSSLQKVLAEQAGTDACPDALYPRSCMWMHDASHNALGVQLWADHPAAGAEDAFRDMVQRLLDEARDCRRLILSSEVMEKTPLRGNGRLQVLLDALTGNGFRVRVVYVVRRQDRMLDSIFKQYVRDDGTRLAGDPAEFAAAQAPDLQFARIAEAWRALRGIAHVHVVPYREDDRCATVGRVLAQMDVAGLDRAAPPAEHLSLEGLMLRAKHFLNARPFPSAFGVHFVEAALGPPRSEPRTTLLPLDERRRFLAAFAADHEALRRRFNVDVGMWTDDAMPAESREVFRRLDPAEIPEVHARLAGVDPSIAAEFSAVCNVEPVC